MSRKKSKSKQPELKPFSEKKQKRYERIARLQYGPDKVNESVRRWASYNQAEQEAILAEGGSNYTAITEALRMGKPVQTTEVQELVRRWHEHIHYFYDPTPEILRGLGQLYTTDPEFGAFFSKFDPALAEYLNEAITLYVDALEAAELARLLANEAGEPLSER